MNLEFRNTVDTSNVVSATVIIVPVHLLHSVFEVLKVLAWLLTQLLGELVIEVLQMVQRDAEHEDILFCIALQLLSVKGLVGEFRLTCK